MQIGNLNPQQKQYQQLKFLQSQRNVNFGKINTNVYGLVPNQQYSGRQQQQQYQMGAPRQQLNGLNRQMIMNYYYRQQLLGQKQQLRAGNMTKKGILVNNRYGRKVWPPKRVNFNERVDLRYIEID